MFVVLLGILQNRFYQICCGSNTPKLTFFNTNCMVQLQVTQHSYSSVQRSAANHWFAADICTAQSQVTSLTQLPSVLLQGIPPGCSFVCYSNFDLRGLGVPVMLCWVHTDIQCGMSLGMTANVWDESRSSQTKS